MNSYSSKQFTEEYSGIRVCDDFIRQANDDEYCFVENPDDLVNAEISQIVIYRWNRNFYGFCKWW